MKRIIKKFNFKEFIKNFKGNFNKYISTNILFLSYAFLTLIVEIIVRSVTVGGFSFKPIIADLIVIIIIGSFGYLFKPKYQFRYFFAWLIFWTCLAIGNTIYYQFFKSFLSVNLLSTASMVGEVNDSLFEKLHFYQFLYLIAPIIFVYIHKKLYKRNYYFDVEKVEKGKKMFVYNVTSGALLIILFFFTLTATDLSRFVKQWNREYVVGTFGIYVYTFNDLVQSIQPKINTLFGYDEAAANFREYYACEWEEKTVKNKYTNVFKGKNVLFIHAESIQNFLIDLKIEGKEVTPNLNKLTKEGLYFSKFYPQISIGTSSDTEFTLHTGLMPSSSGTVFVNYYDRTYASMPKYFSDEGYYTFSMHANNADYWNRKIMHANLGYNDFYAKDSYVVPDESDPDYIGLGLSDKSFFKQIIPILKDIKNKKSPFFGTIITLTNHSPFNDLEKYDEFKVTMDYSYVNDDGEKVKAEARYLEETSMGNYVRSAHYADAALGELFDSLKVNGLLENTVIVIYGDHEARLSKKQFERLYNYDPLTDSNIDKESEDYISMDNYAYDLLKNTPLIIWTADKKYKGEISDVMGMYDVLPTIANMFGFKEKYALGNDIFSKNEKIVVFPNGNVLTNKVYYSNLHDEYITFTNEPIESDYIDRLKKHSENILEVSNGIIVHDLIKSEGENVGECTDEEE